MRVKIHPCVISAIIEKYPERNDVYMATRASDIQTLILNNVLCSIVVRNYS